MLVFVAILLPLTSPCQTSGSFCQPRLTPLCPHCWPSVSPFSPLFPLPSFFFFFLLSLFPLSHVFLLWLPLLLFFFLQLILCLSFLYIFICFPLRSSPQFPFFATSYFFFLFCPPLALLVYSRDFLPITCDTLKTWPLPHLLLLSLLPHNLNSVGRCAEER